MIVVTGASGMVGEALCEILVSVRAPIQLVARTMHPAAVAAAGFTAVSADLSDAEVARDVLQDAQSVIHLAGVSPDRSPKRQDSEVAVMKALVQGVNRSRLRRFVFLSACGADERSSLSWLRNKGIAESILRNSGLPWVIVRAGFIYSVSDRFVNSLGAVVKRAGILRIPLFCRGALRPIAAGDVSIALATFLDHHLVEHKVIDVGEAQPLSLETLLRLIGKRQGLAARIARMPWRGTALETLTEVGTYLRWFAVCEPPAIEEYERLLPMRRSAFAEVLRSYPWGPPPPRPGELLPAIQPKNTGLPAFIPGPHLREVGEAPSPSLEDVGRVDPFGRPLSKSPGPAREDEDPSSD